MGDPLQPPYRQTIVCPVDGCDWTLDATPPAVTDDTLAPMFGAGTLAAAGVYTHRHDIERQLQLHLGEHTTVEWARTVGRLNTELAETRRTNRALAHDLDEQQTRGATLARQQIERDQARHDRHLRLCDGDIPGSPGCIC